MSRVTSEQIEQIRERLVKIPELLRQTADQVEAVNPHLPTCDLDTCNCYRGGLQLLLMMLGDMVDSVTSTLVVIDAWDDDVIDAAEKIEAAERARIAAQN